MEEKIIELKKGEVKDVALELADYIITNLRELAIGRDDLRLRYELLDKKMEEYSALCALHEEDQGIETAES